MREGHVVSGNSVPSRRISRCMIPEARKCLVCLWVCTRASVVAERQRESGGRASRALQGLRTKLPLEKSLKIQTSNK